MSSVQITSVLRGTYEVFIIQNACLEVRVVPQLGGRIVSLLNKHSKREWIWHPEAEIKLEASAPGTSFEDSGHGGIDECFPTVGACVWNNRSLPDHGELWNIPWQVDRSKFTTGQFSLEASPPSSPFRFQRTLSLHGDSLYLDYLLENRGNQAEEFLWAWHPLFRIQPDDRLELPKEIPSMRVEVARGTRTASLGTIWSVPRPFDGVDLGRLDLGATDGACVKGFIGPLTNIDAAAALCGANGDILKVHWSTSENPLLGLWLARGYRGWHHIALEPCSGAPDRLDVAVRDWKLHSTLCPRETRTWSLRLQISRIQLIPFTS